MTDKHRNQLLLLVLLLGCLALYLVGSSRQSSAEQKRTFELVMNMIRTSGPQELALSARSIDQPQGVWITSAKDASGTWPQWKKQTAACAAAYFSEPYDFTDCPVVSFTAASNNQN